MSAGTPTNPTQFQNTVSQVSAAWYRLLLQTQALLTLVDDLGPDGTSALYSAIAQMTSSSPTPSNAANDQAQLSAMTTAMENAITYITTADPAVVRQDNRAGAADVSVTVPKGAVAVVTANPYLATALLAAGTDQSPAIRKPAGTAAIPSGGL